MLILGTDTSSKAATAALMKDGEIICEYTLNINNTHSEKFLPLVEKVLSDTSHTFEDVDFFACGVGPGSFTGIRIGVATIKGLGGALGKKTVGVSTLFALAHNAKGFGGIIVPVIYARADEVFCAAYTSSMEELKAPDVMKIADLFELFKGKKVIFLGDGADKFKEEIESFDSEFSVSPAELGIMRGSSVCAAALGMIEKGQTTEYNELVPVYLRKSQAEREFEEK